ncbi:hypothetical protein [Pseudaminobacter soli (ex Li et al. 2025)]|uniref:Uncharacterized protein n=1 Tax=Pseudaminobacter soli (ex Li et al. 2025) TaxID=1295366 RepID=A0A2P7SNI9_9HYPH|nr:hypothetical protein [Mesorhizobium soli]PSJ63945.1 hypothetical protein C7I85_02170 [Mesorhizobium soli]
MTAGSKRFLKAIAIVAGTSSGVLAAVAQAPADARLCDQLEAELVGIAPRQAPNTAKYDTAIAKQRDQIVKLRNRAQVTGCGFSSTGRGTENCASLNATLAKMESNLDSLQQARAQAAYVAPARSPEEIIAALDANGCREQTDSYPLDSSTEAADRNGRTIEQILSDPAVSEQSDVDLAGEQGNTASLDDNQAIERQSLDPVDNTGQPSDYEIIAGNPPRADSPATGSDRTHSSSIVKPEPPAAPTKVETASSTATRQPPVERDLDPNRKVRVVGPVFLPDPEGAIDLRAPGRKPGQ